MPTMILTPFLSECSQDPLIQNQDDFRSPHAPECFHRGCICIISYSRILTLPRCCFFLHPTLNWKWIRPQCMFSISRLDPDRIGFAFNIKCKTFSIFEKECVNNNQYLLIRRTTVLCFQISSDSEYNRTRRYVCMTETKRTRQLLNATFTGLTAKSLLSRPPCRLRLTFGTARSCLDRWTRCSTPISCRTPGLCAGKSRSLKRKTGRSHINGVIARFKDKDVFLDMAVAKVRGEWGRGRRKAQEITSSVVPFGRQH